jgi:hypothetical protein
MLKPGLQRFGNILFGATEEITAEHVKGIYEKGFWAGGNHKKLLTDITGKDCQLFDGVEEMMLRSLDGTLELPYAFYFTTANGTASMVKKRMETLLPAILQCKHCYDTKRECNVPLCEECEKAGVCEQCQHLGHMSPVSLYRQCNNCLEENKRCIRVQPLLYSMDQCSSQNTFMTSSSGFACPWPDPAHLGRSMLRSCFNWWIGSENCLASTTLLSALWFAGSPIQSLIPYSDLAFFDKHKMSTVDKFISSELLSMLDGIHHVCATIVPPCYPGKSKAKHDNAIDTADWLSATFLSSGYICVMKKSSLVAVNLHNKPAIKNIPIKGLNKVCCLFISLILFYCFFNICLLFSGLHFSGKWFI